MKIRPQQGFLIRPRDAFGSGAWHASRDSGARRHEGIDLAMWPGTPVLAPITGQVVREALPYPPKKTADGDFEHDYLSGLLIQAKERPDVQVKMFYLRPEQGIVGRHVFAGDRIGHAQDLRLRYPGITPHVHLEVWVKGNRVDPTPYLEGEELA